MSRANGITRQEILTAIKLQGAMTAEELARDLQISQVAVRQHLASLEAENLIAITVERRGLGRPSHRYRITSQGDETFPRRYAALADGLLEELGDWQGEEALQTLFTRRRQRATRALSSRMQDKPLAARVQEMARLQTENGYMAEVLEGAAPGEYRLVQHNCAVCQIARRYPHVCCRQEMEFLGDMLGDVTIERESHLLAGDPTCAYVIRG